MNIELPSFLILDLIVWAILILFFIGFTIYINRKPADFINKIKAKTIENKKRLGIKIYRLR
jgi:hypothetical protein